MQGALAESVSKDGKVYLGPDIAAPSAGSQRLQHRLLEHGGRVMEQCDEFLVRARRLIERHLKRRAVLDRTTGDIRSELDDLLGDRPVVGLVEPVKRRVSDAIEVGVVAPDELDEDRFLGLEVV